MYRPTRGENILVTLNSVRNSCHKVTRHQGKNLEKVLRRVSQVVKCFMTHVPARPCYNVSIFKKCYVTCLLTLRAIVKTSVRHCGTYVTYQATCTT
jgi:hypothetical protein